MNYSGKFLINLVTVSALAFFSACSLKYADTVDVEDSVPELYFQNTKITRYENNKITVEVNAEIIEQYKNSSESYAKALKFTSYDEEGEVSTSGQCGYLYADTNAEVYKLFDDIELYNSADKTKFFAEILSWNKKTEQLVSGKNEKVRVEKEDTVINGTGFSSSGISKTFEFSGNVTGEIEAK